MLRDWDRKASIGASVCSVKWHPACSSSPSPLVVARGRGMGGFCTKPYRATCSGLPSSNDNGATEAGSAVWELAGDPSGRPYRGRWGPRGLHK